MARKLRKLKQAQLSALTVASGPTPISQGQISHLENGTRGDEVTADMVMRLARALSVRAEWLYDGDGAMDAANMVEIDYDAGGPPARAQARAHALAMGIPRGSVDEMDEEIAAAAGGSDLAPWEWLEMYSSHHRKRQRLRGA